MSPQLSIVFRSSFRWIDTGVYTWIYKNYAIIHLPNTLAVFLIQFTIIDFMFYWFHRAAHGKNVFNINYHVVEIILFGRS